MLERGAAAGVRVPEDLSIVSWELPTPPESGPTPERPPNPPGGSAQQWLTGVHVPIWEMGHAAAVAAIRASLSGRATHVALPTFASTLQMGHSTAAAPPIHPA